MDKHIFKNSKSINKQEYLSDDYNITGVKDKICTNCGTNNKHNAKYCKKCSKSLQDIICPVCNTVNAFDQHYCIDCNSILQNLKSR